MESQLGGVAEPKAPPHRPKIVNMKWIAAKLMLPRNKLDGLAVT